MVLLLTWLSALPAQAQDEDVIEERLQLGLLELRDLQTTLEERREELNTLQTQLAAAEDEVARAELQERITRLQERLVQLNRSFEEILIGGVDTTVLEETEPRSFNWQEELVEITRPILSSLRELTDRPRRIERLRAEIRRLEQQLQAIQNAQGSIQDYDQRDLPGPTSERIDQVVEEWASREADTERMLESARTQLATLEGESTSWQAALENTVNEFLYGRGLTLLLALVAALITWVILRSLLWIYRRLPSEKQHTTRVRLVLYVYRLLGTVLVILAMLAVFFVRGDLLLLALAVLGLAMLALGLRQWLPRYVTEVRLLLSLGPVRQGERVIYNGLPMAVKSINMYAVLRNPELQGVVRLPLIALNDLVSRPSGNEPWFPCKSGEYVLLSDGTLGLVEQQTLETVRLRAVNSPVLLAAADLYHSGLKNLSREGFGMAVTFGIDYRHQAICLDEVVAKFERGIRNAFADAGLDEHLEGLLVDFKEAGANSLDYLVYASMNGRAAGSYFTVGRVIQKGCVRVCNQEDWGIPFSQLTLHQGEGFEGLRTQAAPQS